MLLVFLVPLYAKELRATKPNSMVYLESLKVQVVYLAIFRALNRCIKHVFEGREGGASGGGERKCQDKASRGVEGREEVLRKDWRTKIMISTIFKCSFIHCWAFVPKSTALR